jgi:hypothetical protein
MAVAEKAAQRCRRRTPARMALFNTIDQFVAKALPVAFAMMVNGKLRERSTDMSLTKRNDPVQALRVLHRSKP